MTNANKFNLLLDVVKLMHSLADGLEAVAYAFADSQEIFVEAKEVSKPVETGQPTKQIAAEKNTFIGRCPCRACGKNAERNDSRGQRSDYQVRWHQAVGCGPEALRRPY